VNQKTQNLWKAIGPGLLFAGAAIGVSHLVQSTRAGALYGLGLVGIVLLANVTKYPALSFGTRYTNGTGESLLEGYRKQGKWTLYLFAVLTLGTMLTVSAAVTFVTASILNNVVLSRWCALTGQEASLILFGIIAIFLWTGGFKWLDRIMKVLLSAMALLTITATVMVLPDLDLGTFSILPPEGALSITSVAFVVALAGWMPAPLDISVWNSLWAVAKQKQTGHRPTPKETRFDFNLGFTLCVVLALCFIILGTVVMHQESIKPAAGGIGISKQIIVLFTGSLGDWSYPIVATCALAVMFSTTLTVLDAFPRVLYVMMDRLRSSETDRPIPESLTRTPGYWAAYALVIGGSTVILYAYVKNLAQLVDLATTLSFVTTPVFAWFNHRAMHS